MKTLAIETSAKAASVAVCYDRALIAQYFQNTGLTHSATLLKMVEELLRSTSMQLSEFDAVAVASGPGSFTGIRIGVAATVGLAWGAGLPACGVSTLEAMAYNAQATGCVVCPVMDARRGQVYNALFLNNTGTIERLTPDRAVSVDELLDEAELDGRHYYLLGDGATMVRQAFRAAGLSCVLAPPPILLQNAWGVACAALEAPRQAPNDLQPVYLRVSQAERERSEREHRG